MPVRTLRSATALALALCACAPARSAQPASPAPLLSPASKREGSELEARVRATLLADAVTAERYARPVLYSWSRPGVAARARAAGALLGPRNEVHLSNYDRAVLDGAEVGDALAVALSRGALARRRWAWPAPWATARPWPGEDYGRALVRLELRPEAWVVAMDAQREGAPRWEAQDLSFRAVPREEVLAHLERVAAVYVTSRTVSAPHLPLREYVVVNEAMVRAWAGESPELAPVLEAERATLEDLARVLRAHPEPDRGAQVLAAAWAEPVGSLEAQPLSVLYALSLALGAPHYALSLESLSRSREALGEALAALASPPRQGDEARRNATGGADAGAPSGRARCGAPQGDFSYRFCSGNCRLVYTGGRARCVPR